MCRHLRYMFIHSAKCGGLYLCGCTAKAMKFDNAMPVHAPATEECMQMLALPETNSRGVKGMASGVPCFLGGSGTPPSVRRIRLQGHAKDTIPIDH